MGCKAEGAAQGYTVLGGLIQHQAVRPARIVVVSSNLDTDRHEFVARVEAAQSVDVSFEVAGPLAELPILEGQTVERARCARVLL